MKRILQATALLLFLGALCIIASKNASTKEDSILSYCYEDVDLDGAEEYLCVEKGQEPFYTEEGELCGEFLCIYDAPGGDKLFEYDLSYVHPMQVMAGDVNGDGKPEISILAYKETEYHPVPAKRPFFYALTDEKLEKVWLGSRLSRPFTDFVLCDMDGDEIAEIVAIEWTKEKDFIVVGYKWQGFGFDVFWESEILKDEPVFLGDRIRKIEEVEILYENNPYRVKIKGDKLGLDAKTK